MYIKCLDEFWLQNNWATMYLNKYLIFCACLCTECCTLSSYIHTLSHTGIRMTACMKLSVCFSFVNVFTSASLNGVVLMGNFSGFHALNTIKNQSSAQKDVRVTPEAPTEISLSALAGVSHLVLLFKCKYQNEAVIFQRTVSLLVSLLD